MCAQRPWPSLWKCAPLHDYSLKTLHPLEHKNLIMCPGKLQSILGMLKLQQNLKVTPIKQFSSRLVYGAWTTFGIKISWRCITGQLLGRIALLCRSSKVPHENSTGFVSWHRQVENKKSSCKRRDGRLCSPPTPTTNYTEMLSYCTFGFNLCGLLNNVWLAFFKTWIINE